MTWLHFANLSALTLVPQFLVFKVFLDEFGLDLSLAALTAALYLGAALVKLLLEDALLASGSVSLTAAFVRALLATLDAVALGVAVSRRRALYAAAFTAGLAWAFTDALTRRVLVFWIKAAGPEYSSEHLDAALMAQLFLVLSLSVAVLVALFLRKSDLRSALAPWIVLGVSVPSLVDWLGSSSGLLGSGALGLPLPLIPLLVGLALTLLVAQRSRAFYAATTADLKRN